MGTQNLELLIVLGWHGATVISTVTSQREGSGFEPFGQLGLFCVEFARSFCACFGFLWLLWFSPTVLKCGLYQLPTLICPNYECE